MAWSAPMTAVANSVFTAAQFNTYVRDNLNETAPAKATAAGRLIVTSGVNSIVERVPTVAQVITSETTTSGTFTDLATVGPSVTVTTGTAAVIMYSVETSDAVAGGITYMDFAVTGATSRSATVDTCVEHTSSVANHGARIGTCDLITGLTAGSNTFTCKYQTSSGSVGTFVRRRIAVLPL